MKKLIVDADDFGLTKGINQGILEAIEKGIITSVSVITTNPYFKEILNLAKKYPHLSVGIHFNLVTGNSLSSPNLIQSLVTKKGQFWGEKEFKKQYFKGEVKISEIRLELEKQIRALTDLEIKPIYFIV